MTSILRFRATALAVILATATMLGGCAATRTQKTAGEQLDDTVITTKVKTSLIANPTTKARQIDVEVFRGTVQLNGFVDNAGEKTEAERVARGVDGVSKVQNNLAVRPGGAATAGDVVDDATITAKVKTALAGDPRTKAHQVNVAASQGVVQLSGFVDSAAAKSAAAEVARSVAGVKSVRNELEVK